jgi:hypothetical protein
MFLCVRELDKKISRGFTNPPSKSEVGTKPFRTQCYVDVYAEELYIWITHIIADKCERLQQHAFVADYWQPKRRCCVSSALVAVMVGGFILIGTGCNAFADASK